MKRAINISSLLTLLACSAAVILSGCATVDETNRLQRSVTSNQSEVIQLRQEMNSRMSRIERENESLSKQVVNMFAAVESRDEKIKTLMGKIDELEYQLKTYWDETKSVLAGKKKPDGGGPFVQKSSSGEPGDRADKTSGKEGPSLDEKYEETYKDAFEVFHKGKYEDAIKKFAAFIETYNDTPLTSNAYYWLGESYMAIKNYEKAIVFFQEIIDRFPKSEKAPRAMLSQAEAFRLTKDKKSSITVLKRVIELYPKSEEASVAERKLRGGGL